MATPAAEASSMLTGLKSLIADLSGVEVNDTDTSASFFELGFDSLFLTQLTQAIQSKYRVKITFRQVMENYSTVDALVAHLDATVAPELRPAAPVPVQATVQASAAAARYPAAKRWSTPECWPHSSSRAR